MHSTYAREWHNFLVRIPPEPPRPLTLRVWLAWLVHSRRTRLTFYLSLMPAFLVAVSRDSALRAIRHGYSVEQLVMGAMFLAPVVACVAAMIEAVPFARLIKRGTRVVTHTHAVRAGTGSAAAYSGGRRVWSFPVTDVQFQYQGGRDGVNIQGVWSGRVRYQREPIEGQPMPVLFDRAQPERRVVLWAYGLTTSLSDPSELRERN